MAARGAQRTGPRGVQGSCQVKGGALKCIKQLFVHWFSLTSGVSPGPPFSPSPTRTFVLGSQIQYLAPRLQTQYVDVSFAVQTYYIKRFRTIAENMRCHKCVWIQIWRASGAVNLLRYVRVCVPG